MLFPEWQELCKAVKVGDFPIKLECVCKYVDAADALEITIKLIQVPDTRQPGFPTNIFHVELLKSWKAHGMTKMDAQLYLYQRVEIAIRHELREFLQVGDYRQNPHAGER